MSGSRFEAWFVGAAIVVTVFAEPAAAQTRGLVARESVSSLGDEAFGWSGSPALSADGRFVAFASSAADLVPGDTNQDTDVFVRDRQTGVVQRVSLAWNGMEARDDSACPAISADGRYVAFLSRAWNLYPGGANLGTPRWDVYVHDRQQGTTTRLSVSTTGGDADNDSHCPAISGDGQRVVFASWASNLVAGDDNGWSDVFLADLVKDKLKLVSKAAGGGVANAGGWQPAISGDGRVVAFNSQSTDLEPVAPVVTPPWQTYQRVYVRDLVAGVTELASRALGHPATWPNEDSGRPSLSADGRYVTYESRAWNIVDDYLPGGHVYVLDRATGVTTVAGAQNPDLQDCGSGGQAIPCYLGNNHNAEISADGRFVVYSSGSMVLLPANLNQYGTRVYLFDRLGGRLRRLSVGVDGWEPEYCSNNPALSADGRVVVYDAAARNIVANDQNEQQDVFSTEWTCDEGGRCRTLAQCPSEPADCAPAASSVLRLRKHPPGGLNQDELFWRWAGAPGEPFPDPAGPGLYQLCLYARSLSLDVAAPEAPACAGAERPCWRAIPKGYKLVDPQGGLSSLMLTSTPGARRILARGGGTLLDAPFLPLDGSEGLVVRLHETGSGRCWGADFPAASISRNVAGLAAPGTRRDGRLSARLP
jgi:Tol biopolymer transport system component